MTENPPLLLEIGVEEIPSHVIAPTLKQLLSFTEKQLSDANISFSPPQVYGTPRRLILFVPHITPQQETKTEIVIGPPKRAAFNPDGNPTAAATGFARTQGVPLSEIQVRLAATLGPAAGKKKGEYLVYEKTQPGMATESFLKNLLPEMISKLTFPRSMRWNQSGVAFVRPIRSILALYDKKIVPFSFAGIQSGDRSFGHQMMSPKSFQVHDFEGYRDELKKRFVMIDPDARVRLIQKEIEVLAKGKNGRLKTDNHLILEAAYTVEYPKALCGGFDSSFLAIPAEIITTAMAEHQGYFPLYGQDGKLLPYFITVSNIKTPDMTVIQKGNERVLRARLVDAQFYFEQDRKTRLSDRIPLLKRVTFQKKLGTLYEKVERITALSRFIAKMLNCSDAETENIQRAAHLCKADLLTGVVREFPSLQGTIGRCYALLEKENDVVASAIEEHYLPKTADGGALPETLAGQILGIADKLDTIVGCFGVGLIPTGSEDPYALRRQGMGILQIVLSNAKLDQFSLQDAVIHAIAQYETQRKFDVPDIDKKIIHFFKRRFDTTLQSNGIRYDLREAVLARTLDRPRVMLEYAEALGKFSKHPLFAALITVYKRVARILPRGFQGEVDEAKFTHESEKALYEKFLEVGGASKHFMVIREPEKRFEALATLSDPLNLFFEDVLVMDQDEVIRHNRLSLLFAVSRPFREICDFSKIVEGESDSKL